MSRCLQKSKNTYRHRQMHTDIASDCHIWDKGEFLRERERESHERGKYTFRHWWTCHPERQGIIPFFILVLLLHGGHCQAQGNQSVYRAAIYQPPWHQKAGMAINKHQAVKIVWQRCSIAKFFQHSCLGKVFLPPTPLYNRTHAHMVNVQNYGLVTMVQR